VTRTGLNLARLAAVLAWSIIPTLAETVLHAFGDREAVPRWPPAPCGPLLDRGAGKPVRRLDLLVTKISPERAGDLAARFGG
jgi:methionyl-tRNA synthetase